MSKDVSITLRIIEQDKEELRRLAEVRDESMSRVIRTAIRREIENAIQSGELITK
jgi:predicted transcriptional regulator